MPKANWGEKKTLVQIALSDAEIQDLVKFRLAHQSEVLPPEDVDVEVSCSSCGGYHDTGTQTTFVKGTDNGSDYGPICWCCLITLAEKAGIIEEGKFDNAR